MSNSTNNPAAGPQYQPETLNPGQDAAGAVSQSGTASATRPAGPQQPRRATIRRATLPGHDATAADSGPIPATAPALPDMLNKAARLASAFEPPKIAKALQAAQTLPDIVAALQKTAEKYSFPGIIADLQKVTTLQDAGILQIKTAAAVCISINATPAGILRQINYFAGFELLNFGKLTAGIFAEIVTGINKIMAYFRAELETNPYYFELVAEKEAAKEAAARAIAEKEATAAELERVRAELELYKAAVNLQEIIKQLPAPATAAGPQPGHPAKQPGRPQYRRRADFMPSISNNEILLIYDNLPEDFKSKTTPAQFAALFDKPIKMPAPIETTPARAAALLAALYNADFIKAAQYAATAAACKCFKFNGKIITATQLHRAKDSNKISAAATDFDYIIALSEKAQI